MLSSTELPLKHALGKRINRDIFSHKGVMLIPVGTIITFEHITVLENHGISLAFEDISPVETYQGRGTFEHEQTIQDIVTQAGKLFEEVRDTRKIPLLEIRRNIISAIHEVANTKDLIGLFASLQAKDDYTYRHNIAVAVISNLLGAWMGMERQELLQLTTAALLHDVGKMLIPEEVLYKPGRLTEEEYKIMKHHTIFGYGILRETIGISHRQALVALQHHERMDGTGYPFGLTEDKIEPFSRIVSVVDMFHAMTSKRVYRNPSPFYEVLNQMEKDTFGGLDPVITRLFIEKIMNSLIGRSVLLTDGSSGTILLINRDTPTRPLVQIGNRFKDLGKDALLQIQQIL